ncbi:hypothetical protein [Proteiniphilum sp.]|uniref:leucine-rich repeat domain-containing protein n=1 Tax=Proteiniphilum sp. TaxID=1926877 RepID=UPI003331334D
MNNKYVYLLVVLLSTVITGCQEELPDTGFRAGDLETESGSVVTLKSGRTDGIISLSVDAPALNRAAVWIDLDGDGKCAEDGTENVKVFNAYQDYTVAPGVSEIAIYGDITYLAAAGNELTSIDVSGSPYLTTLNVPMNNLTAVNVSQNTMLTRLDVSDNDIRSLIVSANTELVSLWCFNNKMTELDVSANSALEYLDCSGNQLGNLDISDNTQLTRLLVYNNQLAALDISQNPLLNRLWAFGNPLADTEAESIVSTLRSVTGGDLWLTEEPLGQTLQASAMEKGWVVQ